VQVKVQVKVQVQVQVQVNVREKKSNTVPTSSLEISYDRKSQNQCASTGNELHYIFICPERQETEKKEESEVLLVVIFSETAERKNYL